MKTIRDVSQKTHSVKDTVKLGDALLDEISELQRSKWQDMITFTEFIHSSRKASKTINKLMKDYTAPQQQCRVTADQVDHQLLLNGKGNKDHVPQRKKKTKTRCNRIHADITIPYEGPAERYQRLKEH